MASDRDGESFGDSVGHFERDEKLKKPSIMHFLRMMLTRVSWDERSKPEDATFVAGHTHRCSCSRASLAVDIYMRFVSSALKGLNSNSEIMSENEWDH